MMFKNLPMGELIRKMFLRMILDGLAAVNSVIKTKKTDDLVAIFKAHMSFYSNLPLLWQKRKRVLKKSSSKLFNQSIVWQYFIRGKKKYSELESL